MSSRPPRDVPTGTPGRVVSLVPSLTEACFAVGLGDRVVGVTDWCVHPADAVAPLPKLGGTKDPDVEAIAGLHPDLVIANHEENTRRVVLALEARGLRVWITYPRSVAEGVEVFAELAGLAPDPLRARGALEPVLRSQRAAEVARAARQRAASRAAGPIGEPGESDAPGVGRRSVAPRVFCPIWRDPWMAVGGDTYAGDLIELCGGENVFGSHGDRRYPKLRVEDIVGAQPDVVLLPDEPYAFGAVDVVELAALDIPAARSGRIHPIDGTWVSWYGPRIAPAIESLRSLLAMPPDDRS